MSYVTTFSHVNPSGMGLGAAVYDGVLPPIRYDVPF